MQRPTDCLSDGQSTSGGRKGAADKSPGDNGTGSTVCLVSSGCFVSVECPSLTESGAQVEAVRGDSAGGSETTHVYHGLLCDERSVETALTVKAERLAKVLRQEDKGVAMDFWALVSGTTDLLEVCTPWDSPLGLAVEGRGGSVQRLGLHNGFDLSTRPGLRKALAELRRYRPRLVRCSPPCTDWSSITNCQNQPDQRKRLQERRRKSRRILEACQKIIQIQTQELDGGFAFEHPLTAQSWQELSVQDIVKRGTGRFRVDGCRFGAVSVKTGEPVIKAWGIVTNVASLRTALSITCQGHHQYHEPLEGRAISASAVYPKAMRKAVAGVLMTRPEWRELKEGTRADGT